MNKVRILVLCFALLCVFALIVFVVGSNSGKAWGFGEGADFSKDQSLWPEALADPVRMSRYPWDEDL